MHTALLLIASGTVLGLSAHLWGFTGAGLALIVLSVLWTVYAVATAPYDPPPTPSHLDLLDGRR